MKTFEFKPAVFHLKMDLVSHSARKLLDNLYFNDIFISWLFSFSFPLRYIILLRTEITGQKVKTENILLDTHPTITFKANFLIKQAVTVLEIFIPGLEFIFRTCEVGEE